MENGYLNFDIWTDPEVRRIIQDRLGCGIDQAEDINQASLCQSNHLTKSTNVFEKH